MIFNMSDYVRLGFHGDVTVSDILGYCAVSYFGCANV